MACPSLTAGSPRDSLLSVCRGLPALGIKGLPLAGCRGSAPPRRGRPQWQITNT
jgi:hypothetical protein